MTVSFRSTFRPPSILEHRGRLYQEPKKSVQKSKYGCVTRATIFSFLTIWATPLPHQPRLLRVAGDLIVVFFPTYLPFEALKLLLYCKMIAHNSDYFVPTILDAIPKG